LKTHFQARSTKAHHYQEKFMAATLPPAALNVPAPRFILPATDGNSYAREDIAGVKGTLMIFICNHCPYVIAVIDRLIEDARQLMDSGVGVAAICSNDPIAYPADRFDKMAEFATQRNFPFPYLHDEDQTVARAYDAVCTPDYFGYDAELNLKYRGRLDEGRTSPPPPGAKRELLDAMFSVAKTGATPEGQTPSIGCSIKWREGA
jgi:peroxiredoxin